MLRDVIRFGQIISFFFQNQILRCNNDPKSKWKCLKILLSKRTVNCPDYIRYNDNDIKGDINIANTFNNYFVDLNKPSDNADDFTYVERTNFNCNEEFVFSPVDDDTILRELSRLDESKSVAIDGISAKPLKLAKEHIIHWRRNRVGHVGQWPTHFFNCVGLAHPLFAFLFFFFFCLSSQRSGM